MSKVKIVRKVKFSNDSTPVKQSEQKPAKQLGYTSNEFNTYVCAVASFLGKRFHVGGSSGGRENATTSYISIERKYKSRALSNVKALKNALVKIGLLPDRLKNKSFSQDFYDEYIRWANIMNANTMSVDELNNGITYNGPINYTYYEEVGKVLEHKGAHSFRFYTDIHLINN